MKTRLLGLGLPGFPSLNPCRTPTGPKLLMFQTEHPQAVGKYGSPGRTLTSDPAVNSPWRWCLAGKPSGT